ncbi:MAG: MFS transporter [Gemmatimonadota bacterium]|nr:MFS transporter [Gemmatimonadota bacterium]MDE2985158.1 MFS transporter [Gemmatimonadota bacterium]
MTHRTAPKDRISFPHKVCYGIGGFVNNLLAQGIGNMMVVLTLALGMDFRAVGLLGSLPRAFDAITDPLVGFISDKTKSRWGRRRPFLFVGAIASGIIFALLWQMPAPTQFRLKLVDYGADGVYSGGETGEPVGFLESVGNSLKGIVTVELIDDVEDEVTILPPALVTGGWVSVDVPLTDFDQLSTREHLSQILISGDLTEVYVDNVYLYRTDDATRAEPTGRDVDGATAPSTAAPTPTVPAEDVISFFSGAYDDVPVQFWSTAWDESEVADAQASGDDVKHYTGMRFAAIDFGETPVDARGMTHVHMDIWTPEPTGEGRSQGYYFWYFLIGSLVFFLAYTVFATPWVALGYELTPDYNERTRLMGVQNFVSNIAFVIGPWFLVIMTNAAWFRNQMAGARLLALAICVTTIVLGVIPAIFLRERMHAGGGGGADEEGRSFGESVWEFIRGLLQTITTGPFLVLCIATFLIFNSFIMISQFQFWVFAFYVSGGNIGEGAGLAGLVATLGTVSGFLVIVIVTWLGTKIGKKNAFFVSTGISMFGYVLKWFCYTPEYPMLALLPAPFLAFGLGGLFTLMGSMIADVVDLDELTTGERREGMFGSVFWWVVKVGQSLALLLGGFLLYSTGLDPALGANQPEGTVFWLRFYDAFVPLVASGIAIFAVYMYPITEDSALEVRTELERRRGAG